MGSAFFGLEIATRSLRAQQRGMEVTGHNIANANTPGFSRQRAVLATTDPYPVPAFNRPLVGGQIGTGVKIEAIQRVRDAFLDTQIRKESLSLGSWQSIETALEQVEVIFNEPSESGLSKVMSDFWNAWQELAKDPSSQVARVSLREQSTTLTGAINHAYAQLEELKNNLDGDIEIKVDQINTIARQIRDLNESIIKFESTGDSANDLRDKRDLLLDELSKVINFSVTESDNGGVLIYIKNKTLVSDVEMLELTTTPGPLNDSFLKVIWADDLSDVSITNGSLNGLIEARDDYINFYMDELDQLTAGIIAQVNDIHEDGFALDGVTTGLDFFTGTGAADIAVNSIFSDLSLIAASMSGEAGDGLNALAIAGLKRTLTMNGATATFDDFYKSTISSLGVDIQEANRLVVNERLLIEQLNNRKESVSGVSLDEEVVNLLKYQRAYEAASRLITVMDEMLDKLINGTGSVGR
ncbi:MAG: flagellar hook-associated protein FlgK [Actinomycetota bacterium]|nr:flagellar hook-associated protein FlgK [Actinomycetota bacterium]